MRVNTIRNTSIFRIFLFPLIFVYKQPTYSIVKLLRLSVFLLIPSHFVHVFSDATGYPSRPPGLYGNRCLLSVYKQRRMYGTSSSSTRGVATKKKKKMLMKYLLLTHTVEGGLIPSYKNRTVNGFRFLN